jgi:hypothetical protein
MPDFTIAAPVCPRLAASTIHGQPATAVVKSDI